MAALGTVDGDVTILMCMDVPVAIRFLPKGAKEPTEFPPHTPLFAKLIDEWLVAEELGRMLEKLGLDGAPPPVLWSCTVRLTDSGCKGVASITCWCVDVPRSAIGKGLAVDEKIASAVVRTIEWDAEHKKANARRERLVDAVEKHRERLLGGRGARRGRRLRDVVVASEQALRVVVDVIGGHVPGSSRRARLFDV